MKFTIWKLDILMLVLIAIIVFTLYIGSTIGLSDNGDYGRVIAPNRISYVEGTRVPFSFTSQYHLEFEGSSNTEKLYSSLFTLAKPYSTIQNIFVKLSILINIVHNFLSGSNEGTYHIEFLGIVYCIFFAFTLGYLIIKLRSGRKWLDILFGVLAIFILCDIGYTEYFNSFYGEPVQFISFVFIFASAVSILFSEKLYVKHILFYYIGIIILIGSKFANLPIGMIFAVAGLSYLLFKFRQKFSRIAIIGCFTLSILSSMYFYNSVPAWMDKQTTYQSVFFGVLKDSPNPEKDLEQLGLPNYMAVLANTNYYTENKKIDINSEQFNKDFYGNISKAKLLKFYLLNPDRLWDKIDISCKNSALIRPEYLSNYGAERNRLTISNRFSLWSNIRERLPFGNIYFIISVFIIGALITLLEFISALRGKEKNHRKIAACVFGTAVLVTTAINLVVPIITNGEGDIGKHMFAFVTGFDLIVLSIVSWLLFKASDKLPFVFKRLSESPKRRKIVIIIVSIMIFLVPDVILFSQANVKYEKPVPGAFILFGDYKGNKLLWRVTGSDENGLLLLSEAPVVYRAFSDKMTTGDANRIKYGSNNWSDCDLRTWLNSDFLRSFTEDDKSMINTYKNKVLLSAYDKSGAEGGNNDFFWAYAPSLVDRSYDQAYYKYNYDKVFLFDVRQFRELLVDGKLPYARNFRYWLETPYYSNSSMVRVVDTDGNVNMQDALVNDIGVLPALYVKPDVKVTGGDGSKHNPFKIIADQ